MAITVEEKVESRSPLKETDNGWTLTRIFRIFGSDTPEDPDVYLHNDLPKRGDGFADLDMEVVDRSFEVQKVGGNENGCILCTVNYAKPEVSANNETDSARDKPQGDAPEYEFSTMAKTQKIFKALAQNHYPAARNEVGDWLNKNNEQVEGVDIYVPNLTYKEIRKTSNLSDDYLRKIAELTGTINSAAWKYWQAREVLFLGASFRRKGNEPWTVEFNFAIEKNAKYVVEILNDDGTTQNETIEDPGWGYVWYERITLGDKPNNKEIIGSRAAHVASVYSEKDFSTLFPESTFPTGITE